eukprot:TRINITY_DN43004_c0_g1_i1.p1 TRINITY_DN43004_c0_g1~~TRINITY_DN43004_c0_g1_i1.p1  ORF type:complete len:940 (+),score=317.71 TRINITY_DN43004_c0_g1_i1:68-2887(+)
MSNEQGGAVGGGKEHHDSLKVIAPQVRALLSKEGEQSDVYRFVVRGKAPANFYGLFGPQVESIAREFLHSTTCILQFGSPGKPFPAVSLRETIFLEIARELVLNRGRKLELWEKEANGDRFEKVLSASPGRVEQFESRFGSFSSDGTSREMGCVAACQWRAADGRLEVGCAYVNSLLRTVGYSTFADTPHFTNLEAFLLQVGARECLVSPPAGRGADAAAAGKVNDVLRKLCVNREEVKASRFQTSSVENSLDVLLREPGEKGDALQCQDALGPIAAVLSFLDLARDPFNAQQYRLRRVDLGKYMRIDQAASLAMNLLNTEAGAVVRGKSSVHSFVDACKTGMGSRLLRMWLTQPLMDKAELARRHDFVELFRDPLLLEAVQGNLRHVPDVDKILKRLQRRRATLADCTKLGTFAGLVPKVAEHFRTWSAGNQENAVRGRVEELSERLSKIGEVFANLAMLIDASVQEDDTDKTTRIKPEFDDELKGIAAEKAEVANALNREYRRALDTVSMTDRQLQLAKHPNHGMILRATKVSAKTCDSCKKFTGLGQLNGAKWYTTETLALLNRQLKAMNEKYEERQKSLVDMLMDTVASYSEPLDEAVGLVSEIDILAGFSSVVGQEERKGNVWCRPVVLDHDGQPQLELKGARHPLVEVQLAARGEEKFVPNDLTLGGNAATLALITGPNMGGKSTFIRTTSVCVLLAQVGMFVPATSMRFTLCDGILARLGATDYMSRGMSTFMVEMLETAAILSTATSRSLVIVDELGRGTSTHDGFGLAWGISEFLAAKVKCRCLFATHFHELTDLAHVHPSVTNLHVTADTSGETLKMLYKVQPGVCARSFGINVAEMTKFPAPVVNMAKRKASELEGAEQSRMKRARHDGGGDGGEDMLKFLVPWLQRVSAAAKVPDEAALRALKTEFDAQAEHNASLKEVVKEFGCAV